MKRVSKRGASAFFVVVLCASAWVLVGCGQSKGQSPQAQAQPSAQAAQQSTVEQRSAAVAREKLAEILRACDAEVKLIPETDKALRYFWTGNDLWEYMSKDSSYDKMVALAYVLGVKDTLGAVSAEMSHLLDVYTMRAIGKLSDADLALVADELLGYARLTLQLKLEAGVDNPPGNKVTAGQIVDIARKYIGDRPEERALPASLLVWRSLSSLESAKSMAEYVKAREEKLKALMKTGQ